MEAAAAALTRKGNRVPHAEKVGGHGMSRGAGLDERVVSRTAKAIKQSVSFSLIYR